MPLFSHRLPATSLPWLALPLGALNVFAFAPFGLWWLQIVLLALFLALLLRASTARGGALAGWAYGFGWSVCGIHWLYVSMHRYGGMPSPMAALAVVLLALYVGAFSAVACGAVIGIRDRWRLPRAATALLVFPACWALSEWLRGWLLTGFPWLASGYAHTDGPLAGYAPAVGVYGIGLVSALVAGAAVGLGGWRRVALLLLILAAGLGLHAADWTVPHGAPIRVRLLQGNVAQEMKFSAEEIGASLALYRDMIRAAPADLIATPETAVPLISSRLPPDYLPDLAGFADRTGSRLLVGLPVSMEPGHYTNSAIGLPAAADAPAYRYDKHHLVPFGEFIPTGFRWFVDMMHIPLGDFDRGDVVQPPFAVRDQEVMPNICYEDLFGGEIARQIRAARDAGKPAPTILLNMSNIAWFGDTIALPQHLQISRMRALETGRPMLRATNTGATATIDPKGRVTGELTPFTRGTLAASVQGYDGATPYVATGDLGTVALCALLLAGAGIAGRRKPHSRGKSR